MSANERRCPDCGVTMEPVDLVTTMDREGLRLRTTERRSGLLGALGLRETVPARGYACPECGLVRLYADPDGD